MKVLKVFLLMILSLAVVCTSTAVGQPAVDLTITVTSMVTGASQAMHLGLDPAATDGLDTGLGEQLAPPLPPDNAFTAQFIGSEIGIVMDPQRQDYRQGTTGTNGVRVHEIQYQAEPGDSVRFSWNLPQGVTGRFQDVVTGHLRDIMMSGTGSYTEDTLTINKFKITLTYALTPIQVSLKVILEGPYNTGLGKMNTSLKSSNYLAGHFTGISIPGAAVDSINIEIRDSSQASKAIVRQYAPAWLLNDGTLRAFADTTKGYVEFPYTNEGRFFVVVRHRNHLAIMSKDSLALSAASPLYDFTTGLDKAYGTNAMKALTGPTYAMFAGDVSSNGQLKYNLAGNDRALILTRIGGTSINATVTGYYNEDVNLDGTVKYNLSGNDRAIILQNIGGANINATLSTQVPN